MSKEAQRALCMTKEPYIYMTKEPWTSQQKPTVDKKRAPCMTKELEIRQKSPIHVKRSPSTSTKEPYVIPKSLTL